MDTVQDKEPAGVGAIARGTVAEEGTEVGSQVGDILREDILEQADIQQVGNQQGDSQQEDSQAADIEVEGNPEVPRHKLLAKEAFKGQQ